MLIHAPGVSPSQPSPDTILKADLYGTAVALERGAGPGAAVRRHMRRYVLGCGTLPRAPGCTQRCGRGLICMSQELAGHCVLVVEDEFFLASEIENALTRAGSDVIGPIPDALSAMNLVLADGFDLAVLDINLGGDLVFPIADALVEQGVPFLFASAYPGSDIPAPHKERPVIAHPNHASELISGLLDLVRQNKG